MFVSRKQYELISQYIRIKRYEWIPEDIRIRLNDTNIIQMNIRIENDTNIFKFSNIHHNIPEYNFDTYEYPI